jgi:hypothetical protein
MICTANNQAMSLLDVFNIGNKISSIEYLNFIRKNENVRFIFIICSCICILYCWSFPSDSNTHFFSYNILFLSDG